MRENGLDGDGGERILRRRLKADGGSRAVVNDQPVSAGLLRDLGTLLVEIHGKHDDRGLLNPRGHRNLLDEFGGLSAELVAVEHAFGPWRGGGERLAALWDELEAAEIGRAVWRERVGQYVYILGVGVSLKKRYSYN